LAEELDVLLDQEREAAAAIEHEIAQQKQSLKRVRIALLAALLMGGAVLLWGVLHRETLRLARELEHARAVGADSFDKLDTCVAAHHIAESEVEACNMVRERESLEHQTTLTRTAATHTEVQRALEGDLNAAQRRHRSCVDDRKQSQLDWDSERASLEGTLAERNMAITAAKAEAKRLTRERDDQDTKRIACELELSVASTKQTECTDKLVSCLSERDAQAALLARPLPASTPLEPATEPATEPAAPHGPPSRDQESPSAPSQLGQGPRHVDGG
jgi:hypothetical protein